MNQGPKTRTVEENQTAPRNDDKNDQPFKTVKDSEATGPDKGATIGAESATIVDQMSHADHPSNEGRNDDPRV